MTTGNHIAELLARSTPSFEAERLILAATEMILELMEDEDLTRMELAKKVGKSKGHISQLLNGKRNMTLKTLAEIAFALNTRVNVAAQGLRESQEEPKGQSSNAYHIGTPWGGSFLHRNSKTDLYPFQPTGLGQVRSDLQVRERPPSDFLRITESVEHSVVGQQPLEYLPIHDREVPISVRKRRSGLAA